MTIENPEVKAFKATSKNAISEKASRKKEAIQILENALANPETPRADIISTLIRSRQEFGRLPEFKNIISQTFDDPRFQDLAPEKRQKLIKSLLIADRHEAKKSVKAKKIGLQGEIRFVAENKDLLPPELYQEVISTFLDKRSTKEKLIISAEIGRAEGPEGQAFFIKKCGELFGVEGMVDRTPVTRARQERNKKLTKEQKEIPKPVANLESTLFLNEKGQIDTNLLSFNREILKQRQQKMVLLMPTIASDSRFFTTKAIIQEALTTAYGQTEFFDEVAISLQVSQNNNGRIKALAGEIKKEVKLFCRQFARDHNESPEKAEERAAALIGKLNFIHASDCVIYEKNQEGEKEIRSDMGFATSAKAQNLQTARKIILENFSKQENQNGFQGIQVMEVDDDYVMGDMPIDYLFHVTCSAMRQIKEEDDFNVFLESYLSQNQVDKPEDFSKKLKHLWQETHDKLVSRTGGIREKTSKTYENSIAKGTQPRENFVDTMSGRAARAARIQSGTSSLTDEEYKTANRVIEILRENRVHLMPEHLDHERKDKGNQDFIKNVLVLNGAAANLEEAQHQVQLLSQIYSEPGGFGGEGGRVTQLSRFASNKSSWLREIGFNELTYPLQGNKSYDLTNYYAKYVAGGEGFKLEIQENIDALEGYIDENGKYHAGMADLRWIHSHIPGTDAKVWDNEGMAQEIFQYIALKAVEYQGTESVDFLLNYFSFEEDGIFSRIPYSSQGQLRFQDKARLNIKRMSLPPLSNLEIRNFSEEESTAFAKITDLISTHKVTLFIFNPMHPDPRTLRLAEELPLKKVIPVMATTSTLAEVTANLGKEAQDLAYPIIIENGGALILPPKFIDSLQINSDDLKKESRAKLREEEGLVVLEIAEKTSPEGIRNKLQELEASVKRNINAEFSLQSFSDIPAEELKKITPLSDDEAIRRAKNRQYFNQPFRIVLPPEARKEDEARILRQLRSITSESRPQLEILEGENFYYLSQIDRDEAMAASILKDILKGNAILRGQKVDSVAEINAGSSEQKRKLFGVEESLNLLYEKGPGATGLTDKQKRALPSHIEINFPPEEALSIVVTKVEKTNREAA